jgi:hypothetical protein
MFIPISSKAVDAYIHFLRQGAVKSGDIALLSAPGVENALMCF